MKNAALQWLSRDPLLHVCMSESIRRGHAEILYAGQDGVLLRDPVAETMQASFVSPAALEPWVETIPVSYTHLDVYKRQHLTPCPLRWCERGTVVWSRGGSLKSRQQRPAFLSMRRIL